MRVPLLLTTLAFATVAHAQWNLQDAHTTASLRGIHSLGNGIAWASGTEGTVLRTEDNGTHWQHCTTPPRAEHLDFRGIQAFDNQTAIVMSSGTGDLSRLYKTTDGCQTWELIFTNPDKDGFWDAISFTRSPEGRIHGWIFGDPIENRFRVFQSTTDDGTHFQADDTPTLAAASPKAGAFAASNSAFLVLQNGPKLPVGPPLPHNSKHKNHYEMEQHPVQWFVTGGIGGARVYTRQPDQMYDLALKEEWTSHPLPLGTDTETSGAFSIMIRSLSSGVIVGGDYAKPDSTLRTAAYRDAKTKSWTASTTPPHGYRSAVAYDTPAKTWITTGPNGTDISTDDGRNWRALTPGPTDAPDADKNWNALSLPFAVGPHGRIGLLRKDALAPHK